jgi:hypothetical protein
MAELLFHFLYERAPPHRQRIAPLRFPFRILSIASRFSIVAARRSRLPPTGQATLAPGRCASGPCTGLASPGRG